VVSGEEGELTFQPRTEAGRVVELRFELDTLVVLNLCQHPLDPNPIYGPKPVQLEVFSSAPIADDDECLNSHPENQRAYQNTEDYNRLRF